MTAFPPLRSLPAVRQTVLPAVRPRPQAGARMVALARPEGETGRGHRRAGDRIGRLALAGGLGLLVAVLVAPPGFAGSSTAESVWDRRNARARALEQVPRGAEITRERCMEIGMRGNEERYRCTVWYTMPPAAAPPQAAPPQTAPPQTAPPQAAPPPQPAQP